MKVTKVVLTWLASFILNIPYLLLHPFSLFLSASFFPAVFSCFLVLQLKAVVKLTCN